MRLSAEQYADCHKCGERYWGEDAERNLKEVETADLKSYSTAEECVALCGACLRGAMGEGGAL